MFHISHNTPQRKIILMCVMYWIYKMMDHVLMNKSKASLYAELMFNHKLIQFLFAKASLKKSVSNLLNQVKYMLYFLYSKMTNFVDVFFLFNCTIWFTRAKVYPKKHDYLKWLIMQKKCKNNCISKRVATLQDIKKMYNKIQLLQKA